MIDVHFDGTLLASFLASSVECVEAMTIVLAVGITRGWRPALAGSGAGFATLAVLVAVLGPSLSLIPLAWLQIAIGVLLVLFGMRWLRKAVLRAAGVTPLHDETAAFSSELGILSRRSVTHHWDAVGIVTSFKAVMLEGIEVVFIVVALGSVGGAVVPASLGAIGAGVLVVSIAVMLRRPLSRVPENTLKLVVGVLLSAVGTFWLGEGYGLSWPGADLAILGLMVGFAGTAMLGVQLIRYRRTDASIILT